VSGNIANSPVSAMHAGMDVKFVVRNARCPRTPNDLAMFIKQILPPSSLFVRFDREMPGCRVFRSARGDAEPAQQLY
jgi:hypothetical protein